jgi:N-acetyl sugar amidotransferase
MQSKSASQWTSTSLRPSAVEGQVCTRCVMDTSDPAILFDDHGVCSHCHRYDRMMAEEAPHWNNSVLEELVARIRKTGKGKPYDCLIGVSGGLDSSYVAWLCKRKFNLRPLAVHFDNGWNTELAVQNIETILRSLDIDLHTHVVDWEEFRDLQLSFLKASISNWELPTDHAIRALLYREAARHGIKYIITGSNFATEAVMPTSWLADNSDRRLLRAIQSKFGTHRLKTFPQLGLLRLGWYVFVKGIRPISILNYVDYGKASASAVLERDLGWRPYAFKHGESLFTRFFQRYYLPTKFGYDKRKPHLSNLILSSQLSRDQALADLNGPLYYPDELDRDKTYVAKKLGLTAADLEQYVRSPPRKDDDYPNNTRLRQKLPKLFALARRVMTIRDHNVERSGARGMNLHIYPSPIGMESRIFRVTQAIKEWTNFDRIVVVGMQAPDRPTEQPIDDRREIIRAPVGIASSQWLPQRLARFCSWYVGVVRRFRREPLACVNCHSLSTLPLGWILKVLTGAKLVYDTHELETETYTMRGARRWLAKLTETTFIRAADAVVVVSPMIGDWYRRQYPGVYPAVVRNLPETPPTEARLNLFRERLTIPSDALIFFYQGVVAEGRGIREILTAFEDVPGDRHVVFLGYGDLSPLVQEYASRHSNIHYLPAVPPGEVRNYTLSGDVGLCIGEPCCLSYMYSLPNKLFEYLGAGAAVIASNLPEIASVVTSSGAGWVIEHDPKQLRDLVRSLNRDDAKARGQRGVQWTRANSWQAECEILKSTYAALGMITTTAPDVGSAAGTELTSRTPMRVSR